MADAYTLDIQGDADPKDIETVRNGLDAYNESRVGPTVWRPVNLFVRDEGGNVVGGLLGGTYWSWMYVDILWVAEELRGHGWGSRLLAQAEAIARQHGCIGVHLDTTDFQARPFYEKQGYTVWGILDDIPPGHQRIFLTKRLIPGE